MKAPVKLLLKSKEQNWLMAVDKTMAAVLATSDSIVLRRADAAISFKLDKVGVTTTLENGLATEVTYTYEVDTDIKHPAFLKTLQQNNLPAGINTDSVF